MFNTSIFFKLQNILFELVTKKLIIYNKKSPPLPSIFENVHEHLACSKMFYKIYMITQFYLKNLKKKQIFSICLILTYCCGGTPGATRCDIT